MRVVTVTLWNELIHFIKVFICLSFSGRRKGLFKLMHNEERECNGIDQDKYLLVCSLSNNSITFDLLILLA